MTPDLVWTVKDLCVPRTGGFTVMTQKYQDTVHYSFIALLSVEMKGSIFQSVNGTLVVEIIQYGTVFLTYCMTT